MRIGQAAEENPVHNAENCCRRADPQRQRRNRRHGKNRVAPESPHRIAYILHHRADPPAGPLFVALLPHPLHAAKFNQRLPPRFHGRHAGGQLRLGRMLHMKPDLFVQFALSTALQPALAKKKPEPGQPCPHHADASWPNTRPMADESRLQLSNSVSSCFLPAAVSE